MHTVDRFLQKCLGTTSSAFKTEIISDYKKYGQNVYSGITLKQADILEYAKQYVFDYQVNNAHSDLTNFLIYSGFGEIAKKYSDNVFNNVAIVLSKKTERGGFDLEKIAYQLIPSLPRIYFECIIKIISEVGVEKGNLDKFNICLDAYNFQSTDLSISKPKLDVETLKNAIKSSIPKIESRIFEYETQINKLEKMFEVQNIEFLKVSKPYKIVLNDINNFEVELKDAFKLQKKCTNKWQSDEKRASELLVEKKQCEKEIKELGFVHVIKKSKLKKRIKLIVKEREKINSNVSNFVKATNELNCKITTIQAKLNEVQSKKAKMQVQYNNLSEIMKRISNQISSYKVSKKYEQEHLSYNKALISGLRAQKSIY